MSPAATDDAVRVFKHESVLLQEVLSALSPRAGGVYLDLTLGGAGHAEAVLEASAPDGVLVGIDRDRIARSAAGTRLERFGARARIHAGTMTDALAVLATEKLMGVDGVLADLGVSSPQLDDPTRGMSFRDEGPIDMRMDDSQETTALSLIESLRDDELANVIYRYGEERASRPIARSIKRALSEGLLHTTRDLARAVYRVLGPPRGGRGIDPATRTFQALRIAVNDELGQLETMLKLLPELLNDGGVAAVISFHSLEDRAVKYAFRDAPTLQVLTKKPIEATDEECHRNPRARSAKLRVARRRPRSEDEGLAQ